MTARPKAILRALLLTAALAAGAGRSPADLADLGPCTTASGNPGPAAAGSHSPAGARVADASWRSAMRRASAKPSAGASMPARAAAAAMAPSSTAWAG